MTDIQDYVEARYPKGKWLHDYLITTLSAFAHSGSADKEYIVELTKGDDTFYSRAWEAVLFRVLVERGFNVTGLPNGGPDFCVNMDGGCDVYIEATTPAPDGLPEAWLSSETNFVGSMPHTDMLLKWTGKLRDKTLNHHEHAEKGHVKRDAPFVVAINACRLSRYGDDQGISLYPFAVETVFPIGPMAVKFDPQTLEAGDAYQSWREAIVKERSGVSIPTDNFINPDYSHVSALIGCSRIWGEQNRAATLPQLVLVHNPNADNPLPERWLPGVVEYKAMVHSEDEIEIVRIG
jgi:type I restriction enzyme S subunit